MLPSGVDSLHHAIFTIRPDGTGRKRLTFSGDNGDPRWSPFGHRILFSGGGGIWVMRADGTHKRPVLDGPTNDASASWAPGGRTIVFVRSKGFDRSRLMKYSLRTETTRPITAGTGRFPVATDPAWSPDGRRIAFVGSQRERVGQGQELFTIHPNGTGLKRITFTPNRWETGPDWSPDGRRLVYGGGPVSTCDASLYTINPDGTNRRRVHAGCRFIQPVWSPNGRKIAAARDAGDITPPPTVWIMSPDGSQPRPLVQGESPDWSPLGAK
jgi:TolB protein